MSTLLGRDRLHFGSELDNPTRCLIGTQNAADHWRATGQEDSDWSWKRTRDEIRSLSTIRGWRIVRGIYGTPLWTREKWPGFWVIHWRRKSPSQPVNGIPGRFCFHLGGTTAMSTRDAPSMLLNASLLSRSLARQLKRWTSSKRSCVHTSWTKHPIALIWIKDTGHHMHHTPCRWRTANWQKATRTYCFSSYAVSIWLDITYSL